MNLVLTRTRADQHGVAGEIEDESGNHICFSLEHAYGDGQGGFGPKIAVGTYVCRRGTHQLEPTKLHPSPKPFETFEICGVPDFQGKPVSGILFHVGNMNEDSSGCVLLGELLYPRGILKSVTAFDAFLSLQSGVDEFTLVVK